MGKVILTFGVIGGLIMMIFVFLISSLCDHETITIDNAEYVGYASMIIGLSTIFFGIKSYRDNYSNGAITFWKGLQIGLLITAIASVLYFVGGELYNKYNPEFGPRVMKKYADLEERKLLERKGTTDEAQHLRAQIQSVEEMMANPIMRFAISLTEILPVGIIVTLVSAGLLRKREFLPTQTNDQGFEFQNN